jgi:hypothetical protein
MLWLVQQQEESNSFLGAHELQIKSPLLENNDFDNRMAEIALTPETWGGLVHAASREEAPNEKLTVK